MILVVMGVSGTGKTTIATLLAARLNWPFVEGDDLHPAANIAKMAAGVPLTADDRWPWLDAVADRMRTMPDGVVTCSALKRSYRDVLRAAAPDVRFVCLVGRRDILLDRMRSRTKHFMPASLLDSQLAAFEPLGPDEPGVTVDVIAPPAEVLETALTGLGLG